MPETHSDSLRLRVSAALQHQYEIVDEIGRGGMSVVYRARDLRLGRDVAVKVLPPELAHDPAVGSRFTREAQTSAQLAHAHIVPIFDVGERDGIAYFVMALITGGSVATRLEHQPLRAVDEVRRLLCETADALAYAHLRGVIHRDIKADNILIDEASGRAMVTDFGIARAMEGGTRLTQTGVAVGTPTYMSPEQAMGERQIDGRSDLYSLGVLGYQMITGRVPFSASNSMALLLKHVSEKPQPIAELRPEAPKQLCDAIERALKKAPKDRWPTASAFRDALMGTEEASPSWRVENRQPLRYDSPCPAIAPRALARAEVEECEARRHAVADARRVRARAAAPRVAHHRAARRPPPLARPRQPARPHQALPSLHAHHDRHVDPRHDRLRLRHRRGAAADHLADRPHVHDTEVVAAREGAARARPQAAASAPHAPSEPGARDGTAAERQTASQAGTAPRVGEPARRCAASRGGRPRGDPRDRRRAIEGRSRAHPRRRTDDDRTGSACRSSMPCASARR